MPTNTLITKILRSLPKRLFPGLLLFPLAAQGQSVDSQVELEFQDFKEWRQTGAFDNFYLGGRTDVFFHDGFWVIAPCICHDPTLFPPLDAIGCPIIIGPSIPCPLGTTAFIAQGDVDGNGRVDIGGFVSAAEVVRAVRVEPFRLDQFKIIAAPPSGIADILRSTNGDSSAVFDVLDATVTLFYNTLMPPVDDYDITVYEAHRHYGPGSSELQRHYKDVPWGTYLFTLPALDDPIRPVPFAVNHLVAPDAYPGRGAVPQGWRIIDTNWFEGDQQLDPRLFFEFNWTGLDPTNVVPSDSLFFSMRGHHYVEARTPGVQFIQPRTRSEIPPEALFEGTVTGVSCHRFPPFPPTTYTIVGISGVFVTTGQDLTTQLAPGATYLMEVTSGGLGPAQAGQQGLTQLINFWGNPDNFTLETPDDLSDPLDPLNMTDPPQLIPGDTFTLSLVRDAVSIVTMDTDLTRVVDPAQSYQASILSGDLRPDAGGPRAQPPGDGVQYPIQIIGPQAPNVITTPDLSRFEFMTNTDVSGRHSSGEVVGTAGMTLTTNRDLANCLDRPSYRLNITSGALSGTSQFPIVAWGNPTVNDLTLTAPLPGLLPGDTFDLAPEDVVGTSTVQTVAGFFVESDRDLGSLLLGIEHVIEITSGALAGQTKAIARWGFPTDFWLETAENLSGQLLAGDTFELIPVTPDVPRLRVGDIIEFTQLFPDWVQQKYDDGELLAVDPFTLSALPIFGQEGYNINPTGELNVAPGLYGVAREDQIVFPPFPIQTPPGDRSEFLLGTLDLFYEFGPFLLQVGDSAAASLNFTRNLPAGSDTYDVVNRILHWEIDFLDTYDGFALLGGLGQQGFPFGTPRSERFPQKDFDHDGITNLMEFALNTNVNDPNDRPAFQFVHDGALGSCSAMITKRPFVGPSLNYFFKYQRGNLVNWTRIVPGDPIFEIVTDTDTTLEVSNLNAVLAGAFPQPSCFLRVGVEVVRITTQGSL